MNHSTKNERRLFMSLALRSHSVPQTRLDALKTRKEKIDSELHQEQRHPSVSDIYLRQLKKMKLQLKEEIESLEKAG
jgi:hypothetical protein